MEAEIPVELTRIRLVGERRRNFNMRRSSQGSISDALSVNNALHFSDEADRNSLKKTLELMENHYVGELNFYERYLFFQRT